MRSSCFQSALGLWHLTTLAGGETPPLRHPELLEGSLPAAWLGLLGKQWPVLPHSFLLPRKHLYLVRDRSEGKPGILPHTVFESDLFFAYSDFFVVVLLGTFLQAGFPTLCSPGMQINGALVVDRKIFPTCRMTSGDVARYLLCVSNHPMTAKELMYSASSTRRCHSMPHNGMSGCFSAPAKPRCPV